MADDLGWMDLACQGNKLVETPNIDRLARQGMRFTSAYAAAPVCSPTRAAVLTGQAPARVHMTSHLPGQFFPRDNRPQPADMVPAIGPEHITIAERLKEAGYANAFLGKWHIAPSAGPQGKVAPGHSPLGQGFDINIGGTSYGGPPSFFSPYRNATLPDGEPGEYLPDRLVDEAIGFIRDHKARPWMVHLWFYTVHWPMEAPEKFVAKYQDRPKKGYNHKVYPAMIEAMDLAIARVLGELDKLEIANETFVVFTSDNGPYGGVGDARPLRADKGHLYEGGIRIPLIVRWPGGGIEPQSTNEQLICLTDLFATVAEIVGVPVPAGSCEDSVSFLPALRGKQIVSTRAGVIHHSSSGAFAYREGNWKMILASGSAGWTKPVRLAGGPKAQLYDLAVDAGEANNRYQSEAEVAMRLLAQFERDVKSGRSTKGPASKNDAPIVLWKESAGKKRKKKVK